jgi:hypothetical protein
MEVSLIGPKNQLVADRPLAQKESIITRHTFEDARRRLKILLAEDNIVNQ